MDLRSKLIIVGVIGMIITANVYAIPRFLNDSGELELKRMYWFCRNEVSYVWAESCAEMDYEGDPEGSEKCLRKCWDEGAEGNVPAEDGTWVPRGYYND